MQVPVELRADAWGGTGVFAEKPILAGKLVWNFQEADVDVIPPTEVQALYKSLDADGQSDVAKFCYFQPDGSMVDIRRDPGRFFNHSSTPNIGIGRHIGGGLQAESAYAIQRIEAGEEIFGDYTTYGAVPSWFPASGFDPSQLVEVRLIKSRGASWSSVTPSRAELERLFEEGSPYDSTKSSQMLPIADSSKCPEYTRFRVDDWGDHKWRMTPCEGILMWKLRGQIFLARSPIKYETVSFGAKRPESDVGSGQKMHLMGMGQNAVPPEFYDLPERRWLQVGLRGDPHMWMLRLYRREPNNPDIDCDPATGQGYTYYVKRAIFLVKKEGAMEEGD
jgi:hypothetical protein